MKNPKLVRGARRIVPIQGQSESSSTKTHQTSPSFP